ncbi:inner membrane transporter RhtA [Microbacterium keratanolyticum]|uniref:DMT transporter permease n=1 Tax=Microbacterium keratanolyticum TaxID=67574 RepID=A0A9W6M827_9MICO|nr:EamA family transporter [Microbacterium keratanolyticum]MBM7469364.1 inner membrane transporter RhtA [Microbacterium keratanolyticum]GLK01445.1 DMT transporter permease [Microbacterium keratanolyticum]
MHAPSTSRPAIGVALVIGSCLSLPFGAAIAVQLFPALGSWGVASLRITIAALVVMLLVRPRLRRWNRQQWGAATLFGLTLAGMNGFFYAAIERIPLGPAVAIEFIGPLVLAAVLTRRRADAIWVGVAIIGIALLGIDGMIGQDPLDLLGVLFVLVAAGFWVLYIRMSARVGALIPGAGGLAVALAVAAVVLLPFGIPATITAVSDMNLLLLAALTALLASVIPYTFELAALRRIPQRVFGVLLSLEPAFATLAGFIMLGQLVSPLKLLAIALVIAASVGTTLTLRKKKGADASQQPPPPVTAYTGSIPVVPD